MISWDPTHLLEHGQFAQSQERQEIEEEVRRAIKNVVWPADSESFIIVPAKKGNGVVPIKNGFKKYLMDRLPGSEWEEEQAIEPEGNERPTGKCDIIRPTSSGLPYLIEWETGNVSSSHRSINKICLLLLQRKIIGGGVVLPTRRTYQYLTDRIGNYEELMPYFQLWRSTPIQEGTLTLYPAEHDGVSHDVPNIPKGKDGNSTYALRYS